jgi:hypothetical protein
MRGPYEPVPALECNPCLWMLVPKCESMLRAMTLMMVYIMFPSWEQA